MEISEPTRSMLTEVSELRYLNPSTLRFFKHGSTLRLVIMQEQSCLHVTIVRLFPLSEPNRYLSIRHSDNTEVGVLLDHEELDAESRRLVEEELERRYLIPVVQRILGVKERFGTVDWQVETDRGRCTYTMRNIRENVDQLSTVRYLFTDIEGNRYDIRDVNALDAASRAYLFRYL